MFVTQCAFQGIQVKDSHIDERFSAVFTHISRKGIVVRMEQQDVFVADFPFYAGAAKILSKFSFKEFPAEGKAWGLAVTKDESYTKVMSYIPCIRSIAFSFPSYPVVEL